VIPSPFTYKRAGSAEEALDLVTEYGEDAKFLAGGHSLLPLMKLRLAAPEVIIDLGGIGDLSYISDQGSHVAIGALTRHHDVEHSELLADVVPLLAHAAGQVGDPQIRHRGTIGGSIAHADPASDLPAVLLALNATIVARGADGSREIPIGEFFHGLFETSLEPDELLTEIRVPKPAPGGWSFQKFTQRAIDWAIVGCAVSGGRVALVNMGGTPLRAAGVEAALAAGASPADAAARAAEGTSAADDIRATRAYREHLARVLVSRALTEANSRSLCRTSSGACPGDRNDEGGRIRSGRRADRLRTGMGAGAPGPGRGTRRPVGARRPAQAHGHEHAGMGHVPQRGPRRRAASR
jgi:carbon-monoxide dehydrogenase medium subunit